MKVVALACDPTFMLPIYSTDPVQQNNSMPTGNSSASTTQARTQSEHVLHQVLRGPNSRPAPPAVQQPPISQEHLRSQFRNSTPQTMNPGYRNQVQIPGLFSYCVSSVSCSQLNLWLVAQPQPRPAPPPTQSNQPSTSHGKLRILILSFLCPQNNVIFLFYSVA